MLNAESVARALQVASKVGEVVYEGFETKRRVERLYRELLKLAAPELLASMGMGGEAEGGEAGVVGLDEVERLRPLLAIREQKSQQMYQDVVQEQMMSLMGGGDSGSEADMAKTMSQSVGMLEQILDSGQLGPEDLASLKEMIAVRGCRCKSRERNALDATAAGAYHWLPMLLARRTLAATATHASLSISLSLSARRNQWACLSTSCSNARTSCRRACRPRARSSSLSSSASSEIAPQWVRVAVEGAEAEVCRTIASLARCRTTILI